MSAQRSAREDLLAAVREVAQEGEVLQQVALAVELVEQARLVASRASPSPCRRCSSSRADAAAGRPRCRPNASPRPAGSARPSSPRRPGGWSTASAPAASQRARHAGSSDQSSIAMRSPMRNHTALASCAFGSASRASLEQAGAAAGVDEPARARPRASTPSSRPVDAVRRAPSSASSMSRTVAPSTKRTPRRAASSARKFSKMPRSIW